MKAVRTVALLALFLSGAVGTTPVWAQYYSGRRFTPPPEEPGHVQYMSGRCRTLYNAINARSGPSYEVMEGMRREFRRDCEEQESDARQRYYDERGDSRRHKYDDRRDARKQADEQYKLQRADVVADRRAQEGVRERSTQQTAQCAESYRILAAKKARTDLSAGELNDLRRFEDNVAARCPR